MSDKIDTASDALDPQCAKCGHKRSEHHYRHPFVGPSQQDTIAELQKKLAEAEAEADVDRAIALADEAGQIMAQWKIRAITPPADLVQQATKGGE